MSLVDVSLTIEFDQQLYLNLDRSLVAFNGKLTLHTFELVRSAYRMCWAYLLYSNAVETFA